jgi:hypothetical protein
MEVAVSVTRIVMMIGMCVVLSTDPLGGQGASRATVSNVRVNPVNGLVQADITLTSPPLPRLENVTGRIRVAFKIGTAEERVIAALSAVNVVRTVNTTKPFPCDQKLPVDVTIVEPADVAGTTAHAELTRTCSRTQGTPDLTVTEVRRSDGGGLQSPRETPIEITVIVKNASAFNLPFNEQGGTPWLVQVTPGVAPPAQTFRLPLQANQEHRYTIKPIALPCGKESEVTVVVDSTRVVLESNENNNTRVFKIAGNRCQDAG